MFGIAKNLSPSRGLRWHNPHHRRSVTLQSDANANGKDINPLLTIRMLPEELAQLLLASLRTGGLRRSTFSNVQTEREVRPPRSPNHISMWPAARLGRESGSSIAVKPTTAVVCSCEAWNRGHKISQSACASSQLEDRETHSDNPACAS